MDKEKKKRESAYIYVRSIQDVDPKKLTIRDLNKKFIDEEGRKYAIKFDFETREIKFVRLASSYQEALRIKQEILKEKQNKPMQIEKPSDHLQEPSSIYNQTSSFPEMESTYSTSQENELEPYDFLDPEESLFDEGEFFEELEKEITRSIQSLKAIENHLNRSHIFDRSNRSLINFFDIQKDIELQCYNEAEESLKLLKELIQFPKPINNYLVKLPESVRTKVESLPSDKQFDYIKRYEIYKNFRVLILNILKNTKNLEEFYYQIPINEREKKPLSDLAPSFAEIKDTMQYLLQKTNTWYANYQVS